VPDRLETKTRAVAQRGEQRGRVEESEARESEVRERGERERGERERRERERGERERRERERGERERRERERGEREREIDNRLRALRPPQAQKTGYVGGIWSKTGGEG